MKIYDETKTKVIDNPDLSRGKLVLDKLLVKHHEAVPETPQKTEFVNIKKFPNGGVSREERIVQKYVPAKEAYDEYEDIQVYVPFTDEEYKDYLRIKRKFLLEVFDIWEKAVLRGREQDSQLIMDWYQNLLDLVPSAFENIPERVQYYL